MLLLALPMALAGGQPAAAQAPAPAAPPVSGLVPDHATLSVENLEREAEWYQRVLGFTVYSRSDANPDLRNWHLVIPGYRIDLVCAKGSARPPRGASVYQQQGWTHVVFHVEDVSAALAALNALNVPVSVSRDKGGVPIQLRIADPEGNEIEIRRNLLV
jgi:catechol 2,3-dioxygenase-like lactoylglutathione lyase family enzyme